MDKFNFKQHCTEFWRNVKSVNFLHYYLKKYKLYENKNKIIKKFTR
jgi:hypothetical protein